MRTDFAITASQLRAIFPEWKLSGDDAVFRSLQKEDVAAVCAIDDRFSEKSLLRSLEAESEAVFLVAASKNGVVGHAHISALHSGEFTFERVSVKKGCEHNGVGTGLVLAFFCFAIHSNAIQLKFFASNVQLSNIFVRLGIKQPKKQVLLQTAIAQLIEKGFCNSSNVTGYTLDSFFDRLNLELACAEKGPELRAYLQDYAKKHSLKTEYLDKVRDNAKDLLRLYLLKAGQENVKDRHVLACALAYLASLDLGEKLDRKFIMYSGGIAQGKLYEELNIVLDALESYKPEAEKKIPRYAIGSNKDGAKELIARLLKNKECLDEKTQLPLEQDTLGSTPVHRAEFFITTSLLKDIFPKLDAELANFTFRTATKKEMRGIGEEGSTGIFAVHNEKIVAYACLKLEGVSLILSEVTVIIYMKHVTEALIGAVLCFAFYSKALYLTVSKNAKNVVAGLQNLGLEDTNLLHRLKRENKVTTVKIMELLEKNSGMTLKSLCKNFKK